MRLSSVDDSDVISNRLINGLHELLNNVDVGQHTNIHRLDGPVMSFEWIMMLLRERYLKNSAKRTTWFTLEEPSHRLIWLIGKQETVPPGGMLWSRRKFDNWARHSWLLYLSSFDDSDDIRFVSIMSCRSSSKRCKRRAAHYHPSAAMARSYRLNGLGCYNETGICRSPSLL